MQEKQELSIVLAGEAGQGIQSIETALTTVFKEAGLHVFATKEYMSRVRGGVNSVQIRVSEKKVQAPVNQIDLFVPLHQAAYHHLKDHISKETVVLGNAEILNVSGVTDIRFEQIAKECGSTLYANMVAAGSICGIMGIEKSLLEKYITARFESKKPEIVEGNIQAAERGYTKASELVKKGAIPFTVHMAATDLARSMMLNGSQAVALGAVAGGCNAVFAYPMTPGSGAFTVLAGMMHKAGIAVEQAEDEIAAINMAIGAWYAGGRALVTTSGGGFALMTEGISLAGMTETPVVVHIAQRPGPATGLPTRTEQGDLNLAIYAGHGFFPKAVFAPGNLEQAFRLTSEAFSVADRFQIPVLILTDQYLVDAYGDHPVFDTTDMPSSQNRIIESGSDYKRYKLTDSGISPRSVPGFGSGRVCADSDEHDEEGRITEDLNGISLAMKNKRARKMQTLEAATRQPDFYGAQDAETLFISWGSTLEPVKEALERAEIKNATIVHFTQVFPLPANLKATLGTAKRLIFIENNQSGAFAELVRQYTGLDTSRRILKYNGLPFSVEELVGRMKEAIHG